MNTSVQIDELRQLYRPPGAVAENKVIDHVDAHGRNFIALSPFCCLGTADEDGRQDVSPRGDVPGFVRVLDEHRLFLPDRPGNNRLDSMRNIIAHPQVGLLFLVPGIFDSLRVNGTAEFTSDDDLLRESAVQGKVPVSGLVIHVQEVFFHCGRAVKRGRLWEAETQVGRDAVPRIAAMIKDQLGPDSDSGSRIDADAPETYMDELY